ncbi:MAG: hypothetical protein RL022_577 [Chloroflexota bacterium]
MPVHLSGRSGVDLHDKTAVRQHDRAWATAAVWIGSGSGLIPHRAFSRASEEHAHEFPADDCWSGYNDLYGFVLVVVANGDRVHS